MLSFFKSSLFSLFLIVRTPHGLSFLSVFSWCDDKDLDLNVVKTRKIIIWGRTKPRKNPSCIHGEDLELVDQFGSLETAINEM